jgi:uncharacterized protein YunC (DUF1805 family)
MVGNLINYGNQILIYFQIMIRNGRRYMNHIKVQLTGKQANGYVIPLGPVNLVNIVTDIGMVGCGAFDIAALNNFGYPAAKVGPAQGSSIVTNEDLLQGIVKEVNPAAEKLGLKIGLTGREALELL